MLFVKEILADVMNKSKTSVTKWRVLLGSHEPLSKCRLRDAGSLHLVASLSSIHGFQLTRKEKRAWREYRGSLYGPGISAFIPATHIPLGTTQSLGHI